MSEPADIASPDLRAGAGRARADRRAAGIRPGAAGGLDRHVRARRGAEGPLRDPAEAARLRVEKIVMGAGGAAGSRARRVQLMQPTAAPEGLAQRVAEAADLVTVALDELLPRAEGPEARLTEAMRYAALGPGKRLRHLLRARDRPDVRPARALGAAGRLRAGVHPRLQPDPRRPALHGRRRHAPRPAHRAQGL